MAMDRDKEVTRRYAQTCLRIGQEYAARNEQQQPAQQRQVEVIDTWGIMTRNVESGEMSLDDYLKDGLHLASVGNNVSLVCSRFACSKLQVKFSKHRVYFLFLSSFIYCRSSLKKS